MAAANTKHTNIQKTQLITS